MNKRLFRTSELGPGELREVHVDGVAIVVIRKRDGSFRALRNRCPHEGGPLSRGQLRPLVVGQRVGEYVELVNHDMLECPWHGYQFDVDTGLSPADPKKLRVRHYELTVRDEWLEITRS